MKKTRGRFTAQVREKNKDWDPIVFIDYEFAAYNHRQALLLLPFYINNCTNDNFSNFKNCVPVVTAAIFRGFDIANHFVEWSYDYATQVRFGLEIPKVPL
jgi:hypothetical protein